MNLLPSIDKNYQILTISPEVHRHKLPSKKKTYSDGKKCRDVKNIGQDEKYLCSQREREDIIITITTSNFLHVPLDFKPKVKSGGYRRIKMDL